MAEVILGRQPIFDGDRRLRGYEILFRSAGGSTAGVVDGEHATATVMLNALVEIGLPRVVGPHRAWFNMTGKTLRDEGYRMLPRDRVVLEVLEHIDPTPENVSAVRRARDAGYTIALDDFSWSDRLVPFVELASVVKVELPAIPESELGGQVERLRQYDVKILAEKVETPEQYQACRAAGFDLYQGYFFCRPDVLREKALPANRLPLMRLIARLQDAGITIQEVEELVEQNLSLSVRMLRLVNSGHFAIPRRIESIRHAAVMLGLNQLRTLATLVLMSSVDDKPHELMVTALVRARMCQLLAKDAGQGRGETYFTVGLLSAVDALLDRPIEEIVRKMSLGDELLRALVEHRGSAGAALRCALDCERGTWEPDLMRGFGANAIMNSWLEAVGWARTVNESLLGGAAKEPAGAAR